MVVSDMQTLEIILANDAAARLFGYSQDDFCSSRSPSFAPTVTSLP